MDFLNLLSWLVVVGVSLVVYLDATSNKIGRVKTERSLINCSAGFWATFVLFIIILGIPVYLILRKRLIDRAKDHPVVVTPKQKKRTIILLTVIGVAISIVTSITSLWPA